MPSLYVGGYFSQLVTSALYPLLVTEAVDMLSSSSVPSVTAMGIPIDNSSNMTDSSVTHVGLVVVLSPASYTNLELGSNMTAASIGATLTATLVLVSYTNLEQSSNMTSAGIGATLTTVLVPVSYINLEQSSNMTSAAITAVTLV